MSGDLQAPAYDINLFFASNGIGPFLEEKKPPLIASGNFCSDFIDFLIIFIEFLLKF